MEADDHEGCYHKSTVLVKEKLGKIWKWLAGQELAEWKGAFLVLGGKSFKYVAFRNSIKVFRTERG